ncbi:MAG: S8 family peptidase [Bacteriovoracaceae bacterium]
MKKLSIGFSLLLGVLAQSAMALAPRYDHSQIFVKMKEGQKLSKSALIKETKHLFGDIYLVKTVDADKLISSLKNDSSVVYTERDGYAGSQAMPVAKMVPNQKAMSRIEGFNDPKMSQLWAFDSKNGMSVLEAYSKLPAVTPEEVIVAVVDTGVDYNHEDLKDIMWMNAGEIPGDGIDNDGNGYIDDVYGINTLIRKNGKATTDPMASHWHGTHVAGTIAATQNNGVGIAGVASNVKIMAIRTVPDDADELDSDIVEAFLYAAKHGAKLINCSFGKKINEGGMVVNETMDFIGKKYGTLVVASAGNDSNNTWGGGCSGWCNNDEKLKYPASFDSKYMIVVASTTNRGAFSSFSNIGPKSVDIAAPGSDIYSTVVEEVNGQLRRGYKMANGTSMASPNATGALAMMLGYNPDLSPLQLKKLAMDTVTKVPQLAGKVSSGGRIDLLKALQKTKTIKK